MKLRLHLIYRIVFCILTVSGLLLLTLLLSDQIDPKLSSTLPLWCSSTLSVCVNFILRNNLDGKVGKSVGLPVGSKLTKFWRNICSENIIFKIINNHKKNGDKYTNKLLIVRNDHA